MTTKTASNIRKIPGSLVADPTDLDLDYPFGGTPLGVTRNMEFRWGFNVELVTAEEWGQQPVEAIYTGEACLFACVQRDLDPDVSLRLFPNVELGPSGAPVTKTGPGVAGAFRPGQKMSGNAVKLVFVPKAEDTDYWIIIYRAILYLESTARLQLSVNDQVAVAMVYAGIPDAGGRVSVIGRKEDISL